MFPDARISKPYLPLHLIIYDFFCHILVGEAATGEPSQNLCWWVGREGRRERGGGGGGEALMVTMLLRWKTYAPPASYMFSLPTLSSRSLQTASVTHCNLQ